MGKNEPVCIADEVPFDIPDSWEWVRLGSVLNVKGGKRLPKEHNLIDIPTNHIYIRVTDMKNHTISSEKLKYITEDTFQLIKNYIINKDDLYLTIAGTIGNVGMVPDKFDGMNLTENAVKLTDIKINKYYLLHIICSNYIQNQFVDKTNKVAQPKLAIERILTTLFPLPPLSEQQRIVDKLKELEPYINDYDKAYEKIEKLNTDFPDLLKKSILQEAVQGKLVPQDPTEEPASVLVEQIRQEKEQLIKDKKIKKDKNESYIFRRDNSHYEKIGTEERCIDDEIPFDIPDSWVWTRLSNIVYNNGQKTPDKDFCYIDIGSINNQEQQLGINENIIKPENAPSRARKIVKYGDIIYSTVRPYLHNMCIIDKTFSMEPIASTGFAVMSCYKGIFNKFLFYYLLAPDFDNYANHTDNAKGVAYPAINDERLYNALIPVPPYQEQIRIVDKLEHLLPKIKDLK